MAKIGRPGILGVLDRLFSFDSQIKVPERVSVEAPVSVVHDISRQAELGAPLNIHQGFSVYNIELVFAGAGSDGDFRLLDSVIEGLYPNVGRQNMDVYIMDVLMMASTSNFSAAGAALRYPSNFPGQTSVPAASKLLLSVPANTLMPDETGANYTYTGYQTCRNIDGRYPQWVPSGCWYSVRATGTGVCVIDFWLLLWAGWKGTRPPGVA